MRAGATGTLKSKARRCEAGAAGASACVHLCTHTCAVGPGSQVLESNLRSSPSSATEGCGPLSKRVNLSASASASQRWGNRRPSPSRGCGGPSGR